MTVVAERYPGKCMGRLNWNGKISGTNISQRVVENGDFKVL